MSQYMNTESLMSMIGCGKPNIFAKGSAVVNLTTRPERLMGEKIRLICLPAGHLSLSAQLFVRAGALAHSLSEAVKRRVLPSHWSVIPDFLALLTKCSTSTFTKLTIPLSRQLLLVLHDFVHPTSTGSECRFQPAEWILFPLWLWQPR